MTRLEHDGAQSLIVRAPSKKLKRRFWRIVRTCPCHRGEMVSVPFATQAEAEHCLRVLDDDARAHA